MTAILPRVIRAFLLSVGQLGDRAILAVLLKTLLLTLAIFSAAGAALWFGLAWLTTRFAPDGYAGPLAAATAVMVMVLGFWLLFRVVAIAVLGLFAEDVVIAVERRHYADALALARTPRWSTAVRMSLASAGRALFFNTLAFPFYLVLLVTGVGSAALFVVLNGWLLGRDLGEMVAVRHMEGAALRPWLRATRGRRFVLGLAATGLFVVPVVALLAPVVGAAMATHLFHGRWRA
jgi:CysZ protein